MSGRTSVTSGRRRRKAFTFGWIAALVVITSALIYWEQTAMLYILATLGVTALLVVVGLADLGGAESSLDQTALADDASTPGTGISSSYKPNQPSSWGARKKG